MTEMDAYEIACAWREWGPTMTRIQFQLTSHFDWDVVRVNVYHLVAPGLVKWR